MQSWHWAERNGGAPNPPAHPARRFPLYDPSQQGTESAYLPRPPSYATNYYGTGYHPTGIGDTGIGPSANPPPQNLGPSWQPSYAASQQPHPQSPWPPFQVIFPPLLISAAPVATQPGQSPPPYCPCCQYHQARSKKMEAGVQTGEDGPPQKFAAPSQAAPNPPNSGPEIPLGNQSEDGAAVAEDVAVGLPLGPAKRAIFPPEMSRVCQQIRESWRRPHNSPVMPFLALYRASYEVLDEWQPIAVVDLSHSRVMGSVQRLPRSHSAQNLLGSASKSKY